MRVLFWWGLPWWLSGKEPTCQYRRLGFDPCVGKIPWRREWQPTPVFLHGKSHGQKRLAGYSLWGQEESLLFCPLELEAQLYQFFEAEGCTLNDVLLKDTQFRSMCHYGPWQYQEVMLSLRHCLRDFTSGPVVENLPCNAGDGGSILGWEINVSEAAELLSPMCTTSRESLSTTIKILSAAIKPWCSHISNVFWKKKLSCWC